MTEVRRALWPAYEDPKWSDPLRFQQGIAGSLELFFWAGFLFQQFAEETPGTRCPCTNESISRFPGLPR